MPQRCATPLRRAKPTVPVSQVLGILTIFPAHLPIGKSLVFVYNLQMQQPPITDGLIQAPHNEKGGWLGPLFYWEIIREARKGRSYLPRVVYASGLLLLLFLLIKGADITLKDASRFGEQSFTYYLLFQYLAVLLLTPVYVAGAFIEDRQQGTLPLLMTTYLTPWELVVGKMLGRLVPMLGVLLAGVPVLAILQLFGGISFGNLLFHTVNVLILLLVTGMQSIRCSTLCKSVGTAVFYSYFRVLGSVFVGYILAGLCSLIVFALFGPGYAQIVSLVVFVGINLWLGKNSLLSAVDSMTARRRDEVFAVTETTPEAMRSLEAVALLRAAHAETDIKPPPEPGTLSAAEVVCLVQEVQERLRHPPATYSQNPPVYQNWPITWKQIYFPDRNNLSVWSVILVTTVFLYLVVSNAEVTPGLRYPLPSYHWTLRMQMSIVLILTMLQSAGCLALERSQRTLLDLLAAPMSLTTLVFQFAWGNLWRYRWLLAIFIGQLCVSLLYLQPEYLLWYPLIFFSQLVCYTVLALVVSMLAQTPFQARLIVSTILFLNLLVLPALLSDWPWLIKVLLMPYAAWEMLPAMLTDWDWLMMLHMLISCVMLWSITAALFFITCALLRRWLNVV